MEEMEIDASKKIPDLDTIRLAESRELEEELDWELHMIFEDESITLQCVSYEKESRKISLQCISVKGKHVVEKQGSKIETKKCKSQRCYRIWLGN